MTRLVGRILAAGVFSLISALISSSASANCAATDCVPRINTVYDLRHTTLTGSGLGVYSSIYLASYGTATGAATPQDGAAGLFLRSSTDPAGSPCQPATDDNGGSILVDAGDMAVPTPHYSCFYRQNINGDLRQWGITKGSMYDVGALGASAADVGVRLNTVLLDLAGAGVTQATTSQVSLYIGTTVTMPITTSLSCGATGGEQITGGLYTGHPGTIYLLHAKSITFTNANDSSFIQNCLILPHWLLQNSPGSAQANTLATTECVGTIAGGPSTGLAFNYPSTSAAYAYDDLEAIRANMIICGDTALSFQANSGGTSHDIWAYGFDNPFYLQQFDHANLQNSAADGDVCYYSVQGGGNTRIDNSICDVTLTKNPYASGALLTHNHCIQSDPTGGKIVCNSEYWQIANITPALGIAKNSYGRDNCELALVAGQAPASNWQDSMNHPSPPAVSLITSIPSTLVRMATPLNTYKSTTPGDPINYPMWISNLSNATAAISCLGHGPYAIQVISSGSSYPTGPYMGQPYVILDLLESEYGMADAFGHNDVMTASATWDQCLRAPCAIRILQGNVNAMEYQEGVTGTDIPTGATIVSVVRNAKGIDPGDGYIAEIMINQPLATAHNGSTGDVTVTITSDPNNLMAYTPSASGNSCDDASAGQCAFFHAGVREFAGQSAAGIASSRLPQSNGRYFGAGYLNNGTPGLQITNAFSFSHHFGYVVQDANSALMTNRGGDDNGELDDLGEQFHVVNGTSNQPVAQGGKGGQSGTGIVNNFYQLTDATSVTTTTTSTINPGLGSVNVADTSGLPTDIGMPGALYGKGTAGLCPSVASGGCTSTNPEEYVTYEITTQGAPGTITITSRGDYFTAPPGVPGTPGSYGSNAQIIATTISRPVFCGAYASTTIPVTNPGQNAVEDIGGCLLLVNATEPQLGKNIFIGTNARATSISNSDFSGVVFLYENAAAFASVSGCGNTLTPNQAWNCYTPPPIASTVVSTTTIDATAQFWPCDATSGPVELIVPPGISVPNQTFSVKKIDKTANVCTVAFSGGDTLDTGTVSNASYYLLAAINQGISFTNTNGTNAWYIPVNPAPIAHGQVYLSYDSGNLRLQLCPQGGSGLIVDTVLESIPSGCLYLQNTSTTGSSVLNYIYAMNSPMAVLTVVSTGASKIKVTAPPGPLAFHPGDQVLATCYGILGATEADRTGLAAVTLSGSSYSITFNTGTYTSGYAGGGQCTLLGLVASIVTHSTASNGVETQMSDPTQTLVGMVYVGPSQTLNDTSTQRYVASWFNRKPKTCIQSGLTTNPTTVTSTTAFIELDVNKRCNFVAWGDAEISWGLGSRVSNGTVSDGAIAAVGFDGTTPPTEQASMINSSANGSTGIKHSLTVSGATGLSESQHYITLLGEAITGGTAAYDAAPSFSEVHLRQ
jgi:hypothetical protein